MIYIGEKRKRIEGFFLGVEHTEFWKKKARDFERRSGCHLIIKREFSLSLQRPLENHEDWPLPSPLSFLLITKKILL